MKIYRIAVDYRISGLINIKANSLREAIEKAQDGRTVDVYDKEYIDYTWNVNEDMSEALYEDEK